MQDSVSELHRQLLLVQESLVLHGDSVAVALLETVIERLKYISSLEEGSLSNDPTCTSVSDDDGDIPVENAAN